MADWAKAMPDWLALQINLANAELKAWKRRHPHEARYVREEALAEVEGREPRYPEPSRHGART